jgi:hypothetical protein
MRIRKIPSGINGRIKWVVPALAGVMVLVSCTRPGEGPAWDPKDYIAHEVSSSDLAAWDFWGMGKSFESGNGQFCLAESDSSEGVILLSPVSYSGDVILRYKTMALTSATVLVAILSASDTGSHDLNIPPGYNGNMGLWIREKENYFYAFRNAAHNFPPFIRKYPVPGNDALASGEENFMLPGVYYEIELGRMGKSLWLNVDGKNIVEASDESMLPGGHVAFRVRGSAGLKAACLIKDLVIYSR